MERIKLSKQEKRVLRMFQKGEDCRPYYSSYSFIDAVDTLQEKGFVKGAFVEGHTLEGLRITGYGMAYMKVNPSLRNPIVVNWNYIIVLMFVVVVSLCIKIITMLHRL